MNDVQSGGVVGGKEGSSQHICTVRLLLLLLQSASQSQELQQNLLLVAALVKLG